MAASTTSIRAPRDADRPTLLMVGSGDPMDAALRLALDRHGLFVEAAATDELRATVQLTAPDLILLLGDAAEQGGVAALSLLASDAASAAVPVVLLAPDAGLESRMHAFRHGAMAVVPRTASADAVARKIASLTREMSEHFEEKTGEIGEATFDELVELVKKELRSGILSVHAPNHKGGPMRVVLGAGRPVAQAVAEFVARLKPHVSAAGAMYYQFHTSAGGPVELLEMDGGTGDVAALASLRVLLVDDDPARADTLAQELRARGSIVFVTDTAGRGLERAVGLDPQVAIVDAAGLEGPGFEVVRAMRKDLRLRWASILVAPWDEIWPRGAAMPDIEKLAARIEPLLVPERDLGERAAGREPFDVRLESTGPGRLLRILVSSGSTFHATVRNPKAVVELDVAEGLLVGATARTTDGQSVEGTAALAALLALGSGRVHVEHRPNPAVANVMTPIDEALSAASAERSVVPASVPPTVTPVRPAKAASPPPPAQRASSPDRWAPRSEEHLPIEDDVEGEAAETQIKDLTGLAKVGEAILVDEDRPSQRPTPLGSPVVEGGPVAANERNRPPRRHRSTLQMGAPAALAPPPLPPKMPELPQAVRPEAPAPPGEAASAPPTEPEAPAPAPELPPSPPGPEAAVTPPPALPEAAPSSPRAAEVTARVPRSRPIEPAPPRKRGAARTAAVVCVALAATVLVAVLALIGYRHSGWRHPELDRVLAMVGAEPGPAPTAPVGEAVGGETPATGDEGAGGAEAGAATGDEGADGAEAGAATADETGDERADSAEAGDEGAGTVSDLLARADRAANAELAERLYRRVLQLEPREHHAMLGLGRILMERGAHVEAAEQLRGAVQRRPRRAAYRILLGDALSRAGDAAGARREWQEALELEPNNRQAQQRLGQ